MSRINDDKKVNNKRFADLAILNEKVFHAHDLANIWGIKNPQTLSKTLSRYTAQGLLFLIYKGLYSIIPLDNIDPYLLGVKIIHSHAYISCESVLFNLGIINQKPEYISIICGQSKRIVVAGTSLRFRKMSDRFLHNDADIQARDDGVRIATLERAIADTLYFNPQKYFDASKGSIDWKKVRGIGDKIGYDIKIPT